jgi:hypothetical protein
MAFSQVGIQSVAFGVREPQHIVSLRLAALALVDLSVDEFVLQDFPSRATFGGSYYTWRHASPYIGTMMLFLLLVLPFALWQLIKEDVFGLWQRPAFRARHVYGTANLLGIVVIITCIIVKVKPLEDAMGDTNLKLETVQSLKSWHIVMLLMNMFMLVTPFFKYNASKAVMDALSGVEATKPKTS